jgi:hypothetical protein
MDPNAAVKLINDAYIVGDLEAADYAGETLHLWLDHGGSLPYKQLSTEAAGYLPALAKRLRLGLDA